MSVNSAASPSPRATSAVPNTGPAAIFSTTAGPTIEVTCDGSVFNNGTDGATGGCGYYVLVDGVLSMLGGAAIPPKCTNNIAELTALLSSLRVVHRRWPEVSSLKLISDSEYVVNGFNRYLAGWVRSQWTKSDGQPVSNQELWRAILVAKRRVPETTTAVWVRGHNGHFTNEVVDAIARVCNERRAAYVIPVTEESRSVVEQGLDAVMRTAKVRRFAAMASLLDDLTR